MATLSLKGRLWFQVSERVVILCVKIKPVTVAGFRELRTGNHYSFGKSLKRFTIMKYAKIGLILGLALGAAFLGWRAAFQVPQEKSPLIVEQAADQTSAPQPVTEPAPLLSMRDLDLVTPTMPDAKAGAISAGVAPVVDSARTPLRGFRGEMLLKGQQVPLQFADGLCDRIHIDENDAPRFSIRLGRISPNHPILISAPEGGSLRRVDGGPLQITASNAPEALQLEFQPTLGRGSYTIRVQNGGESQVIDLWAGALPVRGEPGPKYVAGEFSEEVP